MAGRSLSSRSGLLSRAFLGLAAIAGLAIVMSGVVMASSDNSRLAQLRDVTDKYHSLAVARADHYDPFYQCTDNEGLNAAMGMHYVNFANAFDGEVDPLNPEAVIYEPMPGGGQRLIGVEFVVFLADWDAQHPIPAGKDHADPPVLYGHTLKLVPAGNRYGIPDFYELHAWIWRPNPRGIFDDWNSKVTCRGNGDPA